MTCFLNNDITNRTIADCLIDMTWHLPIPTDFARQKENDIISMNLSQHLNYNTIKQLIYDIISHEDNHMCSLIMFIEHLDIINKEMVSEELSGIDMYDIDMIYEFVNKYIMYVSKSPIG